MLVQQITNINNYNKYQSNSCNTSGKDCSSLQNINLINSIPSFIDSKNFVNVNFKASPPEFFGSIRNVLPSTPMERDQFFKRLQPLNFYENHGGSSQIASQLKDQMAGKYNGNVSSLAKYLQNNGRYLLEVNWGNWMVLLNNDEILPDMRIRGMNYFLSIPSLTLSADNQFCQIYPFFNENDYYISSDANPVMVEHPKYLRIYGQGYADFTEPEDLRLCQKVYQKSRDYYLADIDYYLRTVADYKQMNENLIHDINGIYYKQVPKYDLPAILRNLTIYMNLKDGSLHTASSEAFQMTPRYPRNDFESPVSIIPGTNYGTNYRTQQPQPVEPRLPEENVTQSQPERETPQLFEIEFDEDPASGSI